MRKTVSLMTIYYLLLPFAAALPGIAFTPGPWYVALQKPMGTPPGIVFPVAWTLLYLLMGIAVARVARTSHPLRQAALRLFYLQLLLNAAWTVFFFGLQQPVFALVDLLMLDAAVLLTLLVFRRIDRVAGALLLPYLLWIAFATYLNAGIVWLN
jgi:tryptophan-rich sensory protein